MVLKWTFVSDTEEDSRFTAQVFQEIELWSVELTQKMILKTPLISDTGESLQLIGLSFLFIEMKELCEARAKLEMSSNLADEPTLVDVPPIKTA